MYYNFSNLNESYTLILQKEKIKAKNKEMYATLIFILYKFSNIMSIMFKRVLYQLTSTKVTINYIQ